MRLPLHWPPGAGFDSHSFDWRVPWRSPTRLSRSRHERARRAPRRLSQGGVMHRDPAGRDR